jgi:ubiquinone/menaquinone biosynthesis C-methylase UbiE
MRVADFGCGVGAVTQMLAEMVGPSGHVTGIDVSGAQLDQARQHCAESGFSHVTFVEASATATALPRESGPGCVTAGLLTWDELQRTLADMQRDTEDEGILVLAPPMSQVWARKPAG